MEPLFTLLQIISGAPVVDQRTLAAAAGISVGKANALLKQAEQDGYLLVGREGKKSRLTLTPKGREILENTLIDRDGVKLSFPAVASTDTAVILAGGRRSGFDTPVCLQPVGGEEGTIIDRMLRVLSVCGISRFILIAGWQAEALRAHFAGRGDIEILYNDRYKWNGTMSGLALAEGALLVNTARAYYAAKGRDAEIIKLHGSIELAPVTGLSDVILDVVQTGSTLKANGLVVLEEVFSGITARLVANKVSLKTKAAEILPLIGKLREALA